MRAIWVTVGIGVLQFAVSAYAQEDTVTMAVSPTGAVVRSLILPGWGQLYTGHPIKAVAMAAAFGTCIGVSIYYHQQFRDQQAAIATYQQQFQREAPISMVQVREYYRDRRDEFLIYSAILYAIAALDAYVDAYLADFDVSPDLSVAVRLVPGRMVEQLPQWELPKVAVVVRWKE